MKKNKSSLSVLWRALAIFLVIIISLSLFFSLAITWVADYYYHQGKILIKAGKTIDGFQYVKKAASLSPQEALFFDELAYLYANFALEYTKINDLETAGEYANLAVKTSNYTLALNSRELHFYKTRIRIFVTLSQLNQDFLNNALETAEKASQLAPTDPELIYDWAIIKLAQGDQDAAIQGLKKCLEMKADYADAHWELGEIYEKKGHYDQALEQYQYLLKNINPNDQLVQAKINQLATFSAEMNIYRESGL